MEKMRHLNREKMILIFFNGKNKVIKELTISVGTVNQTVASPRELFVEAFRCEAVSVIMVHNHPSGDPTPSRQDILTTKRMKEIAQSINEGAKAFLFSEYKILVIFFVPLYHL